VTSDTPWKLRARSALLPSVFLGLLIASVAVAQDREAASFQVAMYGQLLLLFIYIASTLDTRSDLRFVMVVLLVSLCLEGLVTLAGYVSGGSLALPGLSTGSAPAVGVPGSRATGTMYSPNNAGSYFAFMFAISAAIYVSRVDARLKHLALVGCVLALVPLGLTLSRGAWVACLVSILVLVAGSRGTRLPPPAVAALVLAIVVMLIPLRGMVEARLTTDDNGSAAGRVPLMRIALDMVQEHPILGVGANNFVVRVPEYAGGQYSGAWISSVHHKYLLIWSEAGFGALLAYLAFVGTALVGAWRLRRTVDPLFRAVGLGMAAAVAGHAVHMNFDIFSGGTPVQMLWVAAAIVATSTTGTSGGGSMRAPTPNCSTASASGFRPSPTMSSRSGISTSSGRTRATRSAPRWPTRAYRRASTIPSRSTSRRPMPISATVWEAFR
jgi:O-antigen ligase